MGSLKKTGGIVSPHSQGIPMAMSTMFVLVPVLVLSSPPSCYWFVAWMFSPFLCLPLIILSICTQFGQVLSCSFWINLPPQALIPCLPIPFGFLWKYQRDIRIWRMWMLISVLWIPGSVFFMGSSDSLTILLLVIQWILAFRSLSLFSFHRLLPVFWPWV